MLSDTIEILKIADLEPFPDHPFQVREDDAMKETAESVKAYGILTPILVRPLENGHYQIVSGHRRTKACELAGVEEIPAIIREMDYDSAVIAMVDSNLQREEILPSEKAAAYRMKLEALRRKAGRPSRENSAQVGQNFDGKTSRQMIVENSPDSSGQIQRYIRLSVTIPTFAGGLSGKLLNGDIVSLIVYSSDKKESFAPDALKYVRVITSTTSGGLDRDELTQKEDGTYDLPSTITLLATPEQARLLAEYENSGRIHAALVCRGNEKQAKKLLKAQAEILEEMEAE
ncbi:MAG: ParB/RepB/Spo0J family partition protein, partial [Bacteroidales bacterium]|nr:ParB/RepB/Spo0J family partition protein [Bacteroidales bacterium]